MTARGPAVALLAILALALAACEPPGVHRKTRGMVRDLAARELGPADKYEAYTSRDSLAKLRRGEMSFVRVRGVNVRPKPGYVLDEVVLEAKNVRVDIKEQRVISAEDAHLTGWISESSMAEMLAHTGVVKDPVVKIEAAGVEIAGRFDLGGAVPIQVTALGTLSVAPPAGITFTSRRVTAAGIPVPFPFSRTLNFRDVYEPLVLHTVSLEPDRALLTGTVDWERFGRWRNDGPSTDSGQ